jgi:glycosyltransferase involved in cell wall biosynthesis
MPVKVSVIVITYNHSGLIEQALESVCRQVTDFKVEVVVSEDASTDGTREIVQEWSRRYPDRTRLLLSERNLKNNEVVRRAFHAARGEFVAMLDGDDYWTSPHKLSAQAAIMDADPNLSLCFHNAQVSSGPTRFGTLWTDPSLKRRLSLADLWEGNPFATCGSLFRRACVPELPVWYGNLSEMMITDWPLYLLFAEQGDIAYLPEPMGVYRLHAGGAYSPHSREAKLAATDRLYRRVNEGTAGRHDEALRRGHYRYFVDMARACLEEGEVSLAATCLRLARGYGRPSRLSDSWERRALEARAWLGSRLS